MLAGPDSLLLSGFPPHAGPPASPSPSPARPLRQSRLRSEVAVNYPAGVCIGNGLADDNESVQQRCVWLARDSQLGRDVALKDLRPEQAHNAALCARFLKEAQITGQLEHPGIVPVYELARRVGTGHPFYTMRFVKGRTLNEAACAYHQKRAAGQADSLEFLALLNAFVVVCKTVAYAHSRGVIHRDLKGQNVIVGDFGEVVVLDWGLAKLVDRHAEETQTAAVSLDRQASGSVDLTRQGDTLGTPAYMAPE